MKEKTDFDSKNKPIKTFYEGHDNLYKKLKSNNSNGWSTNEEYDEFLITIQPMIATEFNERLYNFYDFPKNGNLLEVGCGTGNLLSYFAEKGYKCTGVDISETAVNWAKEKAEENGLEIDFFAGNVTNLSFLTTKFDVVIDGRCLHCIIGSDRQIFYSEIKKILKDNGHLIIYTMVGNVIGEKFKNEFDETSRCLIKEINNEKTAVRFIGTTEIILKEVEENGFEILEYFFRKRKNINDFDDLIIHLKI